MNYNNYPIEECAVEAKRRVENSKVPTFAYQKWTCSHCFSRQTMGVPNVFYRQGICENCKKKTTITECNYMIVMGGDGTPLKL